MIKIALISEYLPPAKNGQAVMLHRLLSAFSPQEYCLLSVATLQNETDPERLAGRYYQFDSHFQITRGYRYGLDRIRELANIPLGILGRARQIKKIIRFEACNAVVACTGDVLDLPAAFLASRQTGVPFYAYIFDHYSYREWWNAARNFWARRLERIVLKSAAKVIVTNEVLFDDLRSRYGINATIIHNSLNIREYETPLNTEFNEKNGIEIVYTGDVYEAHFDAFRNMLAGINNLGRPDVRLHVYTPRTADELALTGIAGPIVCHPHLSPHSIPAIQRQADILFLPLAFDSPYPDLIRTSATTKLGEYLASRRPIIVHAPSDSFVSCYVRRYGCGVVVDTNSAKAISQALAQILSDQRLRDELGVRAWERAQADFDLPIALQKFRALIDGKRDRLSTASQPI